MRKEFYFSKAKQKFDWSRLHSGRRRTNRVQIENEIWNGTLANHAESIERLILTDAVAIRDGTCFLGPRGKGDFFNTFTVCSILEHNRMTRSNFYMVRRNESLSSERCVTQGTKSCTTKRKAPAGYHSPNFERFYFT